MAGEVKSLWVSLKGRTTHFSKAMGKARRKVLQLRRSFQRLTRTVPGASFVMSRFGAALGVVGIGLFVRRSMTAIDTVAKLSDRLGIATESLVGFQHAARITGLEGDALNKGFEVFARRLGEANQGLGEGKRVLDQLGLSSQRLARMDLGDAFTETAEAFGKLKTQADKAAAANALFGRAGVRLISMLDLGKDGIEALRLEAEELGITFSRVEASKVEMANDALTRLGAVLTGVGNRIAIDLAPFVQSASDALVKLGTDGGGAANKVGEALKGLKTPLKIIGGAALLMKGAFEGAFGAIILAGGGVIKVLGNIITPLQALLNGLRDLPGASSFLGDSKFTFADNIQGFGQTTGELGASLLEDAGKSFSSAFGFAQTVDSAAGKILLASRKAAEAFAPKASNALGRDLGNALFSRTTGGGANIQTFAKSEAALEQMNRTLLRMETLQAVGAVAR